MTMVYQAHDPLGEEEDDRNYHRGGDDNPLDYHNKEGSEDTYASNPGDVYDSGEPNEDLQKEDEAEDTIEESLGFSEEDDKKYEGKEDESGDVVKAAATEVFQEGQQPESKKDQKNAKKSIEDAINKAIKEEKEVLHLD